jgi:tryptophanyl-tRNA synthetase
MQVANILLPRAHLVPTGEDQSPHIEMTREVARRFNRLFGEVFPVPSGLIGRVPRLVGIDGQAKMGKSLNNAIYLKDSADVVTAKVMRMFTDPTRIHPTDPGHVEGNPVFMYHDAFNPDRDEVADLEERYVKGKVGDVEVKQKLARALNAFLDPLRERRAAFEAKPGVVREALERGARQARRIGGETLAMVRDALDLDYLKAET